MPQPARYVRFLLSEEDFNLLRSLAEYDGHSTNDFARAIIRRWLRSVRSIGTPDEHLLPDQHFFDTDVGTVERHLMPDQQSFDGPRDGEAAG